MNGALFDLSIMKHVIISTSVMHDFRKTRPNLPKCFMHKSRYNIELRFGNHNSGIINTSNIAVSLYWYMYSNLVLLKSAHCLPNRTDTLKYLKELRNYIKQDQK